MFLWSLPLVMAVMVPHDVEPSDTTVRNLSLDGIVISARVANKSVSSLRLTDISRDKIETASAGRTFPELIRNVPGVYSTAETGSFGDAKINIRGFKQENISVLLNGIPISGLTSGSMYWNNWMGLSDATASIQLQKGIGNSMLSDNSVGGTINIITTQPAELRSSEVSYYHTSYGTNGMSISLASGLLQKGWSFSLMGSHNWGTSYADCTPLSTWSYSAVVTKTFGSRHSLNFTALGSPERHQQRSQRLSYAEVDKYGRSYSKNWGWYTDTDGTRKARTLSQNTYFKPYFTLTHTFDSGNDMNLKVLTTAYGALANGGGFYTESSGKRIASILSDEGLIDWDAVYDLNRKSGRAVNIMSDYLAGHTQLGFKSSVIFDPISGMNIDAGVHYQFFGTWEKEKITDLLGADYWYEDYASKALCGEAGRNPVKKVGDYVRTHNGRDQHYTTGYVIGTYNTGNTVYTLGASVSETVLRRWDAYNYVPENMYSDWTSRMGASVKGGILQKLSASSSVYFNAAAYSRAPYANVFFSSGNNEVSSDLTNEKNYLSELGFRKVGQHFSFEATSYIAYWKDKSLTSASYKTVDVDPHKYMVKGLDALHMGVEVNATYSPSRNVNISAFASLGQWKWRNDVDAIIYDPHTMLEMGRIFVYADGLHVGDAPQTQLGANADIRLAKNLSFTADWIYNDRIWADFDPVTRTNKDDRSESYRIPGYSLVNMALSYKGRLAGMGYTLFVNANNVLDAMYIERSKDGAAHDKATFTGYWGNGRSFNLGIRLNL